MTPDDVRAIVLSLPEVEEKSHMGHPDFRVRNKIFATLTADGTAANLRITRENLDALVAADPRAYAAIWGGRYLGIRLAHVGRTALKALLQDAWALTAPKTLVATFREPSRRGDRSWRSRRKR